MVLPSVDGCDLLGLDTHGLYQRRIQGKLVGLHTGCVG